MNTRARLTNGWPLVGWATLGIGLMAAAILWSRGATRSGFGFTLATTAMVSTLLFLAAFCASSLQTLWPAAGTRWLLRNRRYLGLSFAVSHTYHLSAILGLARIGELEVDTATLVLGGGAFGVIYAMAATSFDRTAALLGPRWWGRLHRAGGYYLWLVLLVTYMGDGRPHPRQLLFIGLLLIGFGTRILALRRRRSDGAAQHAG